MKRLLDRELDVLQRDGTDSTLGLGEDVRWRQEVDDVHEDFINRSSKLQGILHALVDLLAVAVDVESWARADGKPEDFLRPIALMRSADQRAGKSKCVNDFCRAGDAGDDAERR